MVKTTFVGQPLRPMIMDINLRSNADYIVNVVKIWRAKLIS